MPIYSKAIRSLLASSLGLPGMQELLAQEPPPDALEYRYTFYDEEPIPLNRLAFGDPRRYEIESHQFRIVRNLDDSLGLELNYQHETMSGSSPWYSVPGPDGPLQVMSGATIRERRNQVDIALAHRSGGWTHRGAVGYSSENDYRALYASYGGEKDAADGVRTIAWGISYSDDRVEPTDAALYGRVEKADRDAASVSASVTQVLNRNAVVQTGVSLTRQGGYLSDPYKLVWIDRAVVAESRPDSRLMFAWSTRFRHYIEGPKAALTLDYRLFRDDWQITAHTLDAAWRQPVGEYWELAPSVRYHAQSAPDFYAPYFFATPLDGYWSSDFRLSTYGALSSRLQLRYRGPNWSFSGGAEYYASEASWALGSVNEAAPGLVDFWRVSASLRIEL